MSTPPTPPISWLSVPPVRYPALYTAFVLVSAMDIMLTWVILHFDGTEVNPIANLVIEHWGMHGAIVFKFSLTLFVIIVCEVVGRHRDRSGRGLAITAVVISSAPVVWSMTLLYAHAREVAAPLIG